MNTQTVHPAASRSRAIAWARIKLLVRWSFRLALLIFGSVLVLVASLVLLNAAVTLVFGQMQLGVLTFKGSAINLDGYRIDGTTWWGGCVLILFHLLILGLGWDLVRRGRGLRSSS